MESLSMLDLLSLQELNCVWKFQSDEAGRGAMDNVNEFISSPKIRAINVSVHPKAICVLYEEIE
jgi:hypothetical protein